MNIIKVPISEVGAWAENPRNIKTKDFERLKKQIQELGVYKPLIACQENGGYTVLGGNMRLRALQEMGIKEVDISVVEANTEAQKIKYALSDNDRAGEYMEDQLAELVYPYIEEINLEDFKVDLGEAIDLKQVIERYGPDIDDGADDIPEIDDSPAITKTGDLFMLGKHRLLCGDSTKAEDVAKLMRGQKAGAVVTDPPWNVGWDYNTYKDDLTPEQYKEFSDKWREIAVSFIDNGPFFVAMSMKNYKYFHLWFPMAERLFAECQNFVQYTNVFMQYAFNPILVWYIGNNEEKSTAGQRDFYLAETSNTASTPDKKIAKANTATRWPPTIQYIVGNFSKLGDVVYDPFLGSGTTLIAAEKTGRVCYGMEIDPKYCDIIIKRYADYVGISEDEIRATIEHG